MDTPSTFHPADGADVDDYRKAASEHLPGLLAAASQREVIEFLMKVFEGSRGVLRVREGRVGFETIAPTSYDVEMVRSMLPDWAETVIKNGQILEEDLVQLVKKLRKAGVIDPQHAKSILKTAGKTKATTRFIAVPATAADMAAWDADNAALVPSIPKPERFKGYVI